MVLIRCGSHSRRNSSSPLCDNHERCLCVRTHVCAFVHHPHHNQDDSNPYLFWISRSEQSNSSSTSAANLTQAHLHRIGCVPPFNLRHPRQFQVNILKGNLVVFYQVWCTYPLGIYFIPGACERNGTYITTSTRSLVINLLTVFDTLDRH